MPAIARCGGTFRVARAKHWSASAHRAGAYASRRFHIRSVRNRIERLFLARRRPRGGIPLSVRLRLWLRSSVKAVFESPRERFDHSFPPALHSGGVRVALHQTHAGSRHVYLRHERPLGRSRALDRERRTGRILVPTTSFVARAAYVERFNNRNTAGGQLTGSTVAPVGVRRALPPHRRSARFDRAAWRPHSPRQRNRPPERRAMPHVPVPLTIRRRAAIDRPVAHGMVHRLLMIRAAHRNIAQVPWSHTQVPRRDVDALVRDGAPRALLSLHLVHKSRSESSSAAAARTVFSAQPQPLAVARTVANVAPAAPGIERIEQAVRESMTVAMERTVRHEIARALLPHSPSSRRLRERIQSEICDDIVFERERCGGR